MRFKNKVARITYVITPATYVTNERGERNMVRGLRVKFRNNFLDTKAAQREQGWTDDQREQVEKALIDHGDFGRGMYLDEVSSNPLVERKMDQTDAQTFCVATTAGPEGSTICGKATDGGDFCEEHASVLEAAAVAEGDQGAEEKEAV